MPDVSRSPLWHPCTQMQAHEQLPPVRIERAQGLYLYPETGPVLMDGISSWWTNLHGHGHPQLVEALTRQAAQLDHVMLAGLTHGPVEQLAERLVALAPPPLQKVFFADSGSAAVEVALKMSLQFWQQSGQPQRTRFISLHNGYHGETLGSLSVTDLALFQQQYRPLLVDHLRAPSPDLSLRPGGMSEDDWVDDCLQRLEALLSDHNAQVCALIVEPLVQGAAGMRMYPARYLEGLARLRDQSGIHLIFDEIAVGFGRTGRMFALEHAGVCPDFLCLSKGLTGGLLPMSCVLTTDAVYAAFYDVRVERGFLHSHSFTGNPLAAATALASLALFETEQTLARIAALSGHLHAALSRHQGHPLLANLRQTGLIGAFTVRQPGADFRLRFLQEALRRGVWLRPIGADVYVMPPYCITAGELDHLLDQAVACAEFASTGRQRTVEPALP